MSFEVQKFFILMMPNLSIISFVAYAFGVISKKSLPIQGHEDLSSCFILSLLWF